MLLLCLNLTIFIPASYLYQINCVLDLFNSPRNKILLLMFKALLAYNVLTIATMLFLAIFSFYAGLRLWHVKSRAVKTAKVFLVTQLLLILVITIIRPIMTATIDTGGQVFSAILISLIPSLFQFGLWYLYLTKSSRVRNTYGAAAAKFCAPGTFCKINWPYRIYLSWFHSPASSLPDHPSSCLPGISFFSRGGFWPGWS